MIPKEIEPIEVRRFKKPLYPLFEFPMKVHPNLEIPESYKQYVDERGYELNGVYARTYNTKIEALIITSGILQVRYKFPRTKRMFDHPMMSWHNQLHAAGYKNDEISRVIDGKKPLCCTVIPRSFLSKIVKQIEDAGLPYSINEERDPVPDVPHKKVLQEWREEYVNIAVSQHGKVTDYFDIYELMNHYARLNLAEGGPGDIMYKYFEEAIPSLQTYELKHWITGWWDYANPKTVDDIFLTGTLLGYPPEATYAFIFGDIQVS